LSLLIAMAFLLSSCRLAATIFTCGLQMSVSGFVLQRDGAQHCAALRMDQDNTAFERFGRVRRARHGLSYIRAEA
jgi:hypothetical protein